jgi:hypothetical protein
MSGGHDEIGADLRALAQTLLERIDPALRSAVTMLAARSGEQPGRCQQVWCPVCALAALAAGEEHPLLTVIAEHSTALLDLVHAVLDGQAPAPPDAEPDPTGPASRNGRYQSIPVTVEE